MSPKACEGACGPQGNPGAAGMSITAPT